MLTTPAAPQLLMSNHNTGWPLSGLSGSATGMICFSMRDFGCYYPDGGQANDYDYYAVNDTRYPKIAAPGNRLLHLPYGQRRYPELIDHPGQADEVRALLLNDVTLPSVTGTLTINNSGGSNATLYANDYTYDAIGRIIGISERHIGATIEHSYTYNNVGKLIEATTDGVTQTWQYDANGNRTHEDGVQVASYDAQDRLTQYKDNTYQYNALGQLTQKTTPGGTEAYNYDVFGNLRSVNLANGNTIEYLIDPKDRRIGKKVNGVIRQKLLYLGQLNPIAELYPDNSVKNLFIYADKSNVPSAMERYDHRGNFKGRYRIISNHLGSVVMVVNTVTGDIAQEIEYDVWGNVLNDTNPNFQPFYFAGGIYDTDTKLTRFGARDYDAEIGRWTAKDPIGFLGGLALLYDYVGADPVNFVDPSGLWTLAGSVNVSVGFLGVGGTGGVNFVVDGTGNIAVHVTYGGGGNSGAGIAATLGGEYTDANTTNQLLGSGGQTGVNGGFLGGGEMGMMFGQGYTGGYITGGGAVGFNVSGYVTNTDNVLTVNPIEAVRDLFDWFFDKDLDEDCP